MLAYHTQTQVNLHNMIRFNSTLGLGDHKGDQVIVNQHEITSIDGHTSRTFFWGSYPLTYAGPLANCKSTHRHRCVFLKLLKL